jgi:hypothetical protein
MTVMALGSPILSPARMQLRQLAALRPPRTVSTFSVWRSQREMTDMVRGQDSFRGAERHATAMIERKRRDFHHEFTTLRFRALAEHGAWEGRSDIVPRANNSEQTQTKEAHLRSSKD